MDALDQFEQALDDLRFGRGRRMPTQPRAARFGVEAFKRQRRSRVDSRDEIEVGLGIPVRFRGRAARVGVVLDDSIVPPFDRRARTEGAHARIVRRANVGAITLRIADVDEPLPCQRGESAGIESFKNLHFTRVIRSPIVAKRDVESIDREDAQQPLSAEIGACSPTKSAFPKFPATMVRLVRRECQVADGESLLVWNRRRI